MNLWDRHFNRCIPSNWKWSDVTYTGGAEGRCLETGVDAEWKSSKVCGRKGKEYWPGDSKWPFYPLVGGHFAFPKGHLTIPKRSQRIARERLIFKTATWPYSFCSWDFFKRSTLFGLQRMAFSNIVFFLQLGIASHNLDDWRSWGLPLPRPISGRFGYLHVRPAPFHGHGGRQIRLSQRF